MIPPLNLYIGYMHTAKVNSHICLRVKLKQTLTKLNDCYLFGVYFLNVIEMFAAICEFLLVLVDVVTEY